MRIALFLTAIMTCSLLFACTDQEAEKRIQAAEERAVAAEKRAAVAEERLLILEKKITENEERARKEKIAKESRYKKSANIGWTPEGFQPILSLFLYLLSLAFSSIACRRASRAATVCSRAFSAAIFAVNRALICKS